MEIRLQRNAQNQWDIHGKWMAPLDFTMDLGNTNMLFSNIELDYL